MQHFIMYCWCHCINVLKVQSCCENYLSSYCATQHSPLQIPSTILNHVHIDARRLCNALMRNVTYAFCISTCATIYTATGNCGCIYICYVHALCGLSFKLWKVSSVREFITSSQMYTIFELISQVSKRYSEITVYSSYLYEGTSIL